jgi:uncharacterized protein YkwD
MSHTGSDGSTADERVSRAGYRFLGTGENVAAGHTKIAQVMKDWMNSDGHRGNILGDFTEIGGARVRGDDGVDYWTIEFGKPVPEVAAGDFETAFRAALNEARAAKGLNSLANDRVLGDIAAQLARDRVKPNAPPIDYAEVYQQIKDAGYDYGLVSLSVAKVHFDPVALVAEMVKADGAEKTVLGPMQHLGVGVATDQKGIPQCVILLGSLEKTAAPVRETKAADKE